MSAARVLGVVLLAGAALAASPVPLALAQTASMHEVRKGDTLFAVARRARHDGVTRNQMILAIYRANPSAFPGGNINVLEVGTVLAIPGREEVAKIESAEADRQVRELLAVRPTPAQAPMATVKPSPAVRMPARSPVSALPAVEAATKRYQEGVALERRGDHQGALAAYLEAGEAGNGLAQRRLGQIYDKGNTVTQRDYQTALKWYQKAREQGVEMDKPLQRTTPK